MSSLKNQSNKTQTTSCIWFIPTYTVRDPTAILLKFTWHWIEQGKSLTNWRKHVSLRGSRKEYSITKNILPRYVIWGAWKLMSRAREERRAYHLITFHCLLSLLKLPLYYLVWMLANEISPPTQKAGGKKKKKIFQALKSKFKWARLSISHTWSTVNTCWVLEG